MAHPDQERTSGDFPRPSGSSGSPTGDAGSIRAGGPVAGTPAPHDNRPAADPLGSRDPHGHSSGLGGGDQGAKGQAKQAVSDAGGRARDVAGTAQQEAGAVKDTALSAGSDVADSVSEQAGNVAHEVGHQSRRLMDEGLSELQSQAGAGQQRLAEFSRSLGGELHAMTRNSDESGPVTDLAHNAQRIFEDAADWLERSEPSEVLDSVRRYASRNPWTFLAISAGVGFVGARFVRGLQSKDKAPQTGHGAVRQYPGARGGYAPVVGDPTHEGGPRYGGSGRVQPGPTPGMRLEPGANLGSEGLHATPPPPGPLGGQRGL